MESGVSLCPFLPLRKKKDHTLFTLFTIPLTLKKKKSILTLIPKEYPLWGSKESLFLTRTQKGQRGNPFGIRRGYLFGVRVRKRGKKGQRGYPFGVRVRGRSKQGQRIYSNPFLPPRLFAPLPYLLLVRKKSLPCIFLG